jgi:HAD superfamily hydrolase (TIGR01509 family)
MNPKVTAMFDAVIFDLDGTLVDTESLLQVAGTRTFAKLGIEVEQSLLHSLIGKDDNTSAAIIRAAFPKLDFEEYVAICSADVAQMQAQNLPLKPGALEILRRVGQPKAMATSSSRLQAEKKLMLTGLAVHFMHVITLDDVERAKPAPDPFLLAASRLGVDPARCLVFEDSEPGAEAAHSAGMTVVQVPDIIPATGRFAHLVAPDLLTGARRIGLLND